MDEEIAAVVGAVDAVGSWDAKWESNTDHDFDGDDDHATLGCWLYMGTLVWSMIDAFRGAKRANEVNEAVQGSPSMEVAPTITPGRIGARAMMRF